MNDDDFARHIRSAEGPVIPDPRFADRLYLELASELGLRSVQGRVMERRRRRAHPRLLLLAAALLLLGLAAAAAGVGSGLLVRRSVVLPRDAWQGLGGDAARRGEGRLGPAGVPAAKWRFQASGSISGGLSVLGDLVYASTDDGVLSAIDRSTGTERWRFVSDQPPLQGAAAGADRVYVFDGVGLLHALDATTGSELWQAAVPTLDPSNATIGDGLIYAGSGDGSLVAFDAADGTERWRAVVSATGAAHSPALFDGRVFVAADGAGVVAVDAKDGTVAWRLDTGDRVTGTAVVADATTYVGARLDAFDGRLRALDAATGTQRWHVERPLFAPAVAHGVAYAGSVDSGVMAFDAMTGDERWTVPIPGPALPPAVASGVVYVPLDHGHQVRALDAATGREHWRFDVDAPVVCCVAVADGAVFVGTQLGGVYAITGDEDRSTPKD
jgi:outer membrane protein assembly factor BamB